MIYFVFTFFYFLLAYFCSIIDLCYVRYRKVVLLGLCLVHCIFAGIRHSGWADTENYLKAFASTSNIFNIDFEDAGVQEIYREKGFLVISSIIKTFSNSNVFYLLSISILTFYFFYKVLRKYCIYPLIGFCIYLSRFFLTRNMMQIRSALAFFIVLYFTNLVTERKFGKFLLIVLLASSIHYSALMFLPAYFICKIELTQKQILKIVLLVFLFTCFVANFVVLYIVNIPELKAIIYTYIDENTYGYSAGITNPMIYYQVSLLLFYTYQEKFIKDIDAHYFTIRSMYLFGTCLLIFFNMFAVLAGRLSTIFSTYEIIMLPSLLYVVNSRKKVFSSIVVSMIYTAFFVLNVSKV